MPKRLLCPLLVMLSCHLMGQAAYTVEEVPNPKDGGAAYVSDPDDVLSASAVGTLNVLSRDLEETSTAQVAIVILNSIGEENPKEFATRLFQYWGIGQRDVDNGLLIFTVLDQRRTEFETGDGLEGVLPDIICYRIGMQELVPYFKQDEYGKGLIAATRRFKEVLENPDSLEEIRSSRSNEPYSPVPGLPFFVGWYVVLAVLFILFLSVWLIYTNYSKQELYDRYRMTRKVYTWVFLLLFPLPYLLVFPLLKYRLRKLRDQPRYSRKNGKLMHKLNEQADDEFLELGQIVEEEINAVDYDVWVTENQDDILILKYARRWSKYKNCPKCSYRAYHKAHSQVLRNATYAQAGQQEVVHSCKNCHYSHRQLITIPKKQRSSGGSGSGGGGGSWGGGGSSGGGAGVSW